ncbi:uncharacterized protein LOC135138206 isoform X1 [Zophobas morio]|uniref:uncharacterized protein LOC135138206 isoform X1 n=1 Tax=Zophobas morio TaxID=2755281 RepID=UPI003083DBAB
MSLPNTKSESAANNIKSSEDDVLQSEDPVLTNLKYAQSAKVLESSDDEVLQSLGAVALRRLEDLKNFNSGTSSMQPSKNILFAQNTDKYTNIVSATTSNSSSTNAKANIQLTKNQTVTSTKEPPSLTDLLKELKHSVKALVRKTRRLTVSSFDEEWDFYEIVGEIKIDPLETISEENNQWEDTASRVLDPITLAHWLVIHDDLTKAELGGQWLLSAYYPFKKKPAFLELDSYSFEEIRFLFYEGKQKGELEEHKQRIKSILERAKMKIEAFKNREPEVMSILKNICNKNISIYTDNEFASDTKNSFENKCSSLKELYYPQTYLAFMTSHQFDSHYNSIGRHNRMS